MPDAVKAEVVGFENGPKAHHLVEVEQDGTKRRVKVWVDEGAWIGLGWFAGDAASSVGFIAKRYVELHAADGSLKDECFVDNDEAADIQWGRK